MIFHYDLPFSATPPSLTLLLEEFAMTGTGIDATHGSLARLSRDPAYPASLSGLIRAIILGWVWVVWV